MDDIKTRAANDSQSEQRRSHPVVTSCHHSGGCTCSTIHAPGGMECGCDAQEPKYSRRLCVCVCENVGEWRRVHLQKVPPQV